jgi:PadR family transcriptional regulator, regulatory protein PadR
MQPLTAIRCPAVHVVRFRKQLVEVLRTPDRPQWQRTHGVCARLRHRRNAEQLKRSSIRRLEHLGLQVTVQSPLSSAGQNSLRHIFEGDPFLHFSVPRLNGIGTKYKKCLDRLISTYVDFSRMRCSPQTLLVLRALSQTSTPWHYGYALSQITGLKSGTLYPILARMHDSGWVETKWESSSEPGRPPRHLYRLTALGRTEAKRMITQSGRRVRAARLAYEA